MSLSKSDLLRAAQQEEVERKTGQYLASLYPGYHWQTDCDFFAGVLNVKNLTLHGEWGFTILLKDLMNDPDMETVMRAGGELLERCNLPRTFRPEDFKQRVNKDVRGNVIGDVS